MMDLTRIEGTFTCPRENFNIIGCGAVGSHLAIQLVKIGANKFTLFDFDKVEAHNLANQAFTLDQLEKNKARATAELIHAINPSAEITIYGADFDKDTILKEQTTLQGYVFLTSDTPSSRTHILKTNKINPAVLGWFDCRTELFAVQLYAQPHTAKGINELINTLDFTDEQSEANIPRAESGCHSKQAPGLTSTLGAVALTKIFIDAIKTKTFRSLTRIDLDNYIIESF